MDLRVEWQKIVKKWMPSPEGPGSEEYWTPEIETLSRDKLKEIQSEKLEVVARFLYDHSSFWHKKFRESGIRPKDIKFVEDVVKIPIIEKKDIAEDIAKNPPFGSFYGVSDDYWLKNGWVTLMTTGTTGKPLVFRRTEFDRLYGGLHTAQMLWAEGFKPGSGLVLNTLPIGTHPYSWHVIEGFRRIRIPQLLAGPPLSTEMKIRFVLEYKPKILIGTPTYIRFLAEKMLEEGISPSETSVKNLVGGGEPGLSLPFSRQRLAKIWNAKTWEHFGCTESPGGIGGSCIKHVDDISSDEPSSIHVWEDMGICELVDDHNEPVPVGTQGYLVWTDLYSEAGPLLRFKLGDIAVFTEKKCSCGRTSIRVIGGFRGRPGDIIQIGGTSFIISDFESVIKKFDELGEEYRLLITEEKGLSKLKVICEAKAEVPITSYSKIAEELKKAIKMSSDITASVEIAGFNTLERQEFKAKRMIDLREC